MALSNHRCGEKFKTPHLAQFLIDDRVVVKNVPIISCSGCGEWATPLKPFREVGRLAHQLGLSRRVRRVTSFPQARFLVVDFASLPFAKTDG